MYHQSSTLAVSDRADVRRRLDQCRRTFVLLCLSLGVCAAAAAGPLQDDVKGAAPG